MEHRDDPLGAQRPEGILQLSRLLDGGVDKGLDRGLAEEAELAPAEASDEALHAGEPDPLYLDGLLTQHGDARAVKDVGVLLGLAAFIIMVADRKSVVWGKRVSVRV